MGFFLRFANMIGVAWAVSACDEEYATVRSQVFHAPYISPAFFRPLAIEIQEELIGMWPQAHGVDFLGALVVEPILDDVFCEDIALEQEVMVAFEIVKRLVERAGRLRYFGEFLGFQVV